MGCHHYQNNSLFIEDCAVKDIVAHFGSPCYIYSKAKIKNNWQNFSQAFQSIPHRLCYAVKANSNIAILNTLVDLQAGFDIVSIGELERVLRAGGDAKKVIFSGIGKTQAEIKAAIFHNIYCFDVESSAELNRLYSITQQLKKNINIALRINPDVDSQTHVHIITGSKKNKFGIDLKEALFLSATIASMPTLNLIGIACHIGSQITTLDPFREALSRMVQLYQQLTEKGFKLRHINMGGGLGIVYHHEQPPSFEAYAKTLGKIIAKLPVELILEPGRAVIGNAGILVTRVEYLKHTQHKNFAIVDAGMNDLLRPALYDAWQNILPVQLSDAQTMCYDIGGPVCESADFLGKERNLALQEGDLLAIDCAGAYGFTMSSNYNSRLRVAEILVDGDKAHLIRRRETIDDLLTLEKLVN